MLSKSHLATAGLALAGLLALSSCASSSGAGDSSSDQAGAGQKLGMVGLYQGPYPGAIAAGAQAAADEDGAEFTQYGTPQIDPSGAIADFQNAVASGTKGMLVQAYPADLWQSPIDKAAGLGVVVATSDNYSEGSKAVTEVGAPKAAMGAGLAAEYLKQIPEDASGIIVPGLCVAGLPVLEAPIEGFRTAIERERANVKVIDTEATSNDPAENFAAWQRIQAKYPDAIGFVGGCDIDVPNLIKLKQSQPGAAYLVGVTAGGDDPTAIAPISTGVMVGAVEQNAWLQGYVGMKLIANSAFRGDNMPVGWINTGYTIVTKDNAAQVVDFLKNPASAEKVFGDLGEKLVADAATIAHDPVTYQYDQSAIDEPNPQP